MSDPDRPPDLRSLAERRAITSRADFESLIGQRTPDVDKDDLILQLCDGRSVLDLGCIDHSAETALALGDRWLHRRISAVADSVVGLDMLGDDAAELNQLGYDIMVADAASFDLGRTFDVVVAGDLIEHLSNIGHFLECIDRHVTFDSVIVVTTPNPFNVEQITQAIFNHRTMVNTEHVVQIDPRAMFETVRRSPLEIIDFRWVDTRFHFELTGGRVARRVVNPLTRALMRRRPLIRRDYAVVLRRRR